MKIELFYFIYLLSNAIDNAYNS